MNALALLRVLIVALGIAMLAGCIVSKIAEGRPGVDLSPIVPGSTRAQAEAILGPPLREWTTSAGIRYGLYQYDAGVPPAPEKAVAAGVLDAAMLGIPSAVSALVEPEGLGPSQYRLLALSYGTDDRIVGVFEGVTEFSVLPEDGRAHPEGKK